MGTLFTIRHWTQKTKVLPCLLITLMSICAAAAPDWTDCPQPCQCKWASGKKTALCRAAGFTDLPRLSPELQVVDFQQNLIPYLNKDAFSSIDLFNLQKIYMKNTTLKDVHRDAFRDLKILVDIDLSYNQITYIPRGLFSGNDRLKILSLSGNPLQTLTSEQFPSLPHLRTLDLEDCQLEIINNNAFVHLSQLENLNLKSNLLTITFKSLFLPIVKLKALDLVGNPWVCDCKLRDFRNWYLASNLHSASLSCSEPEYHRGRSWEEISSLQFACAADIKVDFSEIQRDLGENVTFGCRIRGDPEPEVLWLFNEHPIGSTNSSRLDQIIEVEERIGEKWVNLSLVNLTEADAGDYVCQAKSFLGTINRNVSLILYRASSSSFGSSHSLFIFLGVLAVVMLILKIIISAIACSCISFTRKRRRKRSKRKSKVKGSRSFYDQEKHLLDISTSNTEQASGKSSCEILSSHASMELLKHQPMSIDRFDPGHYGTRRSNKEATAVIPLSAVFPGDVYPPPPEFSNNLPHSGTLGNIYISVQLTQDPMSIEGYPDLLDAHRPSKSKKGNLNQSSSFCSMTAIPYATLPRRQLRPLDAISMTGPVYDNMGKRVTVGGSSVLSLPDEYEGIPTPPPPPISSIPQSDYTPL